MYSALIRQLERRYINVLIIIMNNNITQVDPCTIMGDRIEYKNTLDGPISVGPGSFWRLRLGRPSTFPLHPAPYVERGIIDLDAETRDWLEEVPCLNSGASYTRGRLLLCNVFGMYIYLFW